MLIYLLAINALGLGFMLFDKYSAKNNLRRIPEATLIGIAAAGGSIGCLVGMYSVRHKTRHVKFTIGVPLILAIQIFSLYLYFH